MPLCAILPMLAACSGRHRLATKHLERAEYESAASVYSRLLEENPKDTRAIAGIRRAREGVVGERLITIRFARLGQNLDQALESLRQLVEDEKNWAVYPTGAVYSSQRDEAAGGYRHFARVLQDHLDAGRAVPARLHLERFKPVFWQGDTLAPMRRFAQQIDDAGRQSCASLATEVTDDSVYFREFVEQYCQYWGRDNVLGNKNAKRRHHKDLFSAVTLDYVVTGLPPESGGAFIQEQLQEALEASPYYDPRASNRLPVKLRGHFSSLTEEAPVDLEHSYKEREVYAVVEEVKGRRTVPYEEVVEISSSPARTVKRTKYRTEEYSEQRPVTRTRYIPKTRQFQGVRYRQELALLIEGTVVLAGRGIAFNVSGSDQRGGVSHDLEIPDIGLRRRPKRVIEVGPWLTAKLAALRSSFSDKVEALWFDLYCSASGQETPMQIEEMVHRCRKSKRGQDSEFVARWFKSRFGVSPSQIGAAF